MVNNVISRLFDYGVNQSSPVQKDFERKVSYDEEGNEFVSFLPVDYPSLQKKNGNVGLWSLNALLKAGINPDTGIHTGLNTRIEGASAVAEFEAVADEILSENENKSE